MIELTPEQHEALTQNGSQPIRAIDRVTRIEYVLVRADLYERLVKKWGLAPAVPCITKETSLLGRCLSPLCAVTRRRSSVGAIPTRQLSLQPVAIGAVVEVTKLPKPLMERTVKRFREQAGRNASERRAGLETGNVGADPAMGWGRPRSQVSGERNDPSCGPTGVMATACLDREIGRNTGDPKPWTT